MSDSSPALTGATEPDMIAALRRGGYVADDDIATALYLAEQLDKPILIEGEAGVGKTEVARVLAKLKDTELVRLQCYEGLDFNTALYEWNYQKQILSMRVRELRNEHDITLADLYSEEFLSYRPISRALMAERRVVLLLDEIDRADEEFEALLLETLAEYQLTIPEIGSITAKHKPYIVLTSNRTRELTDALRRRCLYLWIDYPDYAKELEVLRLKVPGIGMVLASQAAHFVQALRQEKLNKVPGLAEAVDWTRALLLLGVATLDRSTVAGTLGCLLKDRQDIERCKGVLLDTLLEKASPGAVV
jgi:MoxR-like ATPase